MRYEVKHTSSHSLLFRLPCARSCTPILFNIHWTPLSNYNFLHHHHILPCLKAVTENKNLYAYFHACIQMCAPIAPKFCSCVLDTSLIIQQCDHWSRYTPLLVGIPPSLKYRVVIWGLIMFIGHGQ